MSSDHERKSNRLVNESSPYLLQHAYNPVDWFAWGDEAFELARKLDRPIFLSVGYSTCYWCHVMERQCFENDSIAAVMNRHFINIKLDREERPDVDQLYMNAVQLLTRRGGWPMSVWMTPDRRPFYAGTYFPPEDTHGLPAFPKLLEAIADAWKHRRDDIEQSANQLRDALIQLARPREAEAIALSAGRLEQLVLESVEDYEPQFGGFGTAPKFPRQTLLDLLLDFIESKSPEDAGRKRIEPMLSHTLHAMADGGIRDQLGGAFHRYSTDAQWLVPHFEIMLYDQAMLARVYARASILLNEERFAAVARGICDFVLSDLTSEAGSFFTALDAEANAREGATYLWKREAIDAHLSKDVAEKFARAYGLDAGPNFADPHHGDGTPEASVLFVADRSLETDPDIVEARKALLAVRRRRPQPMLDTKIITAWNALMIESLATVGRLLDVPDYVEAAAKAVDFLLCNHLDKSGRLLHVSRDGRAKIAGQLDDYAFLADALLAVYDATSDVRWRHEAAKLADEMISRFGDRSEGGGLFFTADDQTDLLVRQKTAADSPLPAGNAVAADVLRRLDRGEKAAEIVGEFAGQLLRFAPSMSQLLGVALRLNANPGQSADAAATVVPAGKAESAGVVGVRGSRVGRRRIDLVVDIAAGFHLYDTNLDATLGLSPTRVVAGADSPKIDSIDYPPAKLLELAYGPRVAGYTGRIEIAVRFHDDLPPGPVELVLMFQACDERACLKPARVRVSV